MQETSRQNYSFEGFTLDLTRGCLWRGNEEVKLRPKSFSTLKYLVENSGRLVSKDEIISAVWPDTAVTDNSLVQCLKEVREALGDSSQHFIKTVPRRGYVFHQQVKDLALEMNRAEEIDPIRVLIDEESDSEGRELRVAEQRSVCPRTVTRPANGWLRHTTILLVRPVLGLAQRVERNLFDFSRSRSQPAGKMIAAPVLIAGLLVSLLYFWMSSRSRQAHTIVGVRSIAVLPFKPLGQDETDRDLGLGMADTLITRLSAVGGIVVRPTSAVQRYASPDQDSLAAGREQVVDVVLEGSIQRSGDRLRVTVRLLNVRDGSALWADKYDQKSTEVFVIQDTISERVAGALALKLGGERRKLLAKRYTENIEAYQLYVRGVYLRNQLTDEGLKKSIEYLQKAIELDPNYALAYAGLASSIAPQAYRGTMTAREVEMKNKQLISKALELDDTLAEAHAALAEVKLFLEWDWEGAEREFKRTLELNPNEPLAHLIYPALLSVMGRFEESIAISKRALEIDPLSPRACYALGKMYLYAGRYDQFIEQSHKTLELFPGNGLINPGQGYEQKGMYDQAVKEYLDWEGRVGMRPDETQALRQAHAVGGWRAYWQKRLELARAEEKQRPVQSVFLAELYARLGDNDQALDWLERAYEERHPSLIFLNLDPKWESLRTDPRFQSLLQHIRLAP